jgi:aldehyde dehydrogenase (NAD+)
MALELAVRHQVEHYVDGAWTPAADDRRIEVVDPATEAPIGWVPAGDASDVELAVMAARAAAKGFGRSSQAARGELLRAVLEAYDARVDELASAITREVGAPVGLARGPQTALGAEHLSDAIELLSTYPFEAMSGSTRIVREPIGVCGLITPSNWPVHQILCKVAPALAAGCTMVLKPSEVAPLNAIVLAEVMDAAGVPPGVFNLVHGDGPAAGAALAAHPGVDFVSFTGSTVAGIEVASLAAETVKRVTQELGGKSPAVVLEDADLGAAVEATVAGCFANSGQSYDAPTRLLVPAAMHDEAAEIAAGVAGRFVTGDPQSAGTDLGPVVSEWRFNRVQTLIETGVRAGARLVAGGAGRPDGIDRGWFVRPTVFAGVDNDMPIARAEIFGPVLSILPYSTEADAVRIANDTEYGLAAYVWSSDRERARAVASLLRAGQVTLNGAPADPAAPFGGYKHSGNGREAGPEGIEPFLETKAILGYGL